MRIRFSFGNLKLKPSCRNATQHIALLFWLLTLWRLSFAQHVEIIDNKDSRVSYGQGWKDVPGAHLYNGSMMLTRHARAVAQVAFQGIGISVYGTQGTSGGNVTKSLYIIDTASPVEYVVPPTLQETQYNIPFYQSPQLSDQEHTLLVVNENHGAWYWLDYFKVTSAENQMATATPTVDSGTVGSTRLALLQDTPFMLVDDSQHSASPTFSDNYFTSSSSNQTTQATLSDVSSQTTSSRSTVPAGAIAGIVISSIILVSVGVFVIWWRTRQRDTENDALNAQNIDPFYRNSGTNAGPAIHGISTPYTVEYFPSPGASLPPPPRITSEKHPVVNQPQCGYPLDYYEQGTGLPRGAGTPQFGPGMFQSFGTASLGVMESEGRGETPRSLRPLPVGGAVDAQRSSSFLSTNRATYGSEDASWLQQQRKQASRRPVLLS